MAEAPYRPATGLAVRRFALVRCTDPTRASDVNRPQLVVEVSSPFDTWGHVFGKVGSYLEAGVSAVIVVDFETRTASVDRNSSTNPQQIFGATDALILPELAVPVASLFV